MDLDNWPTPEPVIRAILPIILGRSEHWDVLIDPGCGEGAILRVVSEVIQPATTVGIEIDGARARVADNLALGLSTFDGRPLESIVLHKDFLSVEVADEIFNLRPSGFPRRLVVMNPPYSKPSRDIGVDFTERALEIVGHQGLVAALLPLDFASGVDRFVRLHRYPCGLYPLVRRPRFANGRCGMRPVAWFVWDLAHPYNEWSPLDVADTRPVVEQSELQLERAT